MHTIKGHKPVRGEHELLLLSGGTKLKKGSQYLALRTQFGSIRLKLMCRVARHIVNPPLEVIGKNKLLDRHAYFFYGSVRA